MRRSSCLQMVAPRLAGEGGFGTKSAMGLWAETQICRLQGSTLEPECQELAQAVPEANALRRGPVAEACFARTAGLVLLLLSQYWVRCLAALCDLPCDRSIALQCFNRLWFLLLDVAKAAV